MSDRKIKQNLIGKVVSAGMQDTVSVEIVRLVAHPVYKKRIKKHKKFLSHVNEVVPKVGDVVRITATKPISKNKRWRVSEILQESKSLG
tara:strand:- start:38 stop:304 length:267 start_codon:yes stop_codon:yes gene_type:complete